MSEEGLRAAEEKMRRDAVPDPAIATFAHYYEQLEAGESGLIGEDEIEPVRDLPDAEALSGADAPLDEAVVIKLNGGLGTSMGMSRAKSLLEVKEGLSFLDVIARQVLSLREASGARIPLVLMNSFHTRDDSLARLRSRTIGFVFQSYNLLPRTSALENVATPLLYQGVGRTERLRRARATLERLGLGDRVDHEPTELSGGQQQRVAMARALVTEPALILADEPTGNLDSHAGAEVTALLRELHRSGRTIVLITHDIDVAATADRQIHLLDGRLAA